MPAKWSAVLLLALAVTAVGGEEGTSMGQACTSVEQPSAAADLEAPLPAGTRRPRTCIYAIALNERKRVQSFMDACKGADLVLVADTGSTDGTPEALRALGAVVHAITVKPWRFDSARNMALGLLPADCDLCLSLDLDDQLQPGWVEALRAAWARSEVQPTAVQYHYVNSWERDGITPAVELLQTKFHARWNYTWRGPAYELPYWTGAAGEERVAAVPTLKLHHYPDASKSRTSHLELLRLGAEEDPTDAWRAFHFGRELMLEQQPDAAIAELQRYLALPGATWREERAAALRLIAQCHEELQQPEEAQAAAHRGVLEWGESREPWLALAHASHQVEDWQTCYWAATKALAITDRGFSKFDDGSAWGPQVHDYAALGAFYSGLHEEAVVHGQDALGLDPDSARYRDNLEWYRSRVRRRADLMESAVMPALTTLSALVARPPAATPRLHLITVSNEADNPAMLEMIRIASRFGLRVLVLTFQSEQFLMSKMQALRDFCATLSVAGAGTDLVMMVDAWDVVFRGPEEGIVSAYKRAVGGKRAVLVSAEAHCFPECRACASDARWYAQHRPTNSSYRYLNSGGMIGPADLIMQLIDSVVDWTSPPLYENDQRVWHNILTDSNYSSQLVLDTQAEVFMSLFDRSDDLSCQPGQGWINRETGRAPFVFHANGSPKDFLFDAILPSFQRGLLGDARLPAPVCP